MEKSFLPREASSGIHSTDLMDLDPGAGDLWDMAQMFSYLRHLSMEAFGTVADEMIKLSI